MTGSEEAVLLEKIRSGDQQAFAAIYRKYTRKLQTFAYRFVKDDAIAQEVTQDVFACFYNAIDRYEGRCSLSSWLHRITHNKALEHMRKIHQQRKAVDMALEQFGERQRSHRNEESGDPSYIMEQADLRYQLYKDFQCLSQSQREAMMLVALDWSCKDIEARLGLSQTGLKNRLHLARVRLREIREGRLARVSGHKKSPRLAPGANG